MCSDQPGRGDSTTILVTGSSGFIGGSICRYLGPREIIGLDLVRGENRLHREVISDIASEKFIDNFKPEGSIDAVVHTVAYISSAFCQQNPLAAFRVNFGGTLNMLEIARKLDIKRFIYISSGGVYGTSGPNETITESRAPAPDGIYSTTKVSSELAIMEYCKSYSINGIALRITAPYGPGMNGSKYPFNIPDSLHRHTLLFAIRCVHSQDIDMPVGGDHTVNYTYVDDIAEAARLSLTSSVGGFEVFNIAGGKNYTIRELGEAVASLCPSISVSIGPGDLLKGLDPSDPMLSRLHIKQGLFDISKARRMLGFVPKYDLREGMKRLIEYVKLQAKRSP
ncbi:MAG: NAD(P)-dependent oxidoreductase [Thermoplasmataceae archaeon]